MNYKDDPMERKNKYTRQEIKEHISNLKKSMDGVLEGMEKCFDIAFDLDWNSMLFEMEVEEKTKKVGKKRTTKKETIKYVEEKSKEGDK